MCIIHFLLLFNKAFSYINHKVMSRYSMDITLLNRFIISEITLFYDLNLYDPSENFLNVFL